MMFEAFDRIVTIVLGGLFGWCLGHLPKPWIFAIACAAICGALIVLSQ